MGKNISKVRYHLDTFKSIRPHSIHPRVTEVPGGRAQWAIFHQLSSSWVEVSKCDPHLQEGTEEGSRPAHLTSVLKKVMEQITLSVIMQYSTQDHAQHGFMEGRSCLTDQIFFCDKVHPWWMRERMCNKAFDTISQRIVLETLLMAWMRVLWAA